MKDPLVEKALDNIKKSVDAINNEMNFLTNEGVWIQIGQDDSKQFFIKSFRQQVDYLEEGVNRV